jgi:hypothetical protein
MAKGLYFSSAAFSRNGSCYIKRVTFFNGHAAAQGVSLSPYSLPVGDAPLKLIGSIGVTSQFDFDGFPFPSGFVVTPSDAAVTNIIVEYDTALE